MKKVSKKLGGVTSQVVSKPLATVEDDNTQTLEEEAQEAAEGAAVLKAAKKAEREDSFTNLLIKVFGLKGCPMFKGDFCDPRWPRLDNGELIRCERVYYLAIQGPREENLGVQSLGERETFNLNVILDKIPKDSFWTQDRIMAKKWVAEQCGYRYFWIVDGEKLEFDLDDPESVFNKRFAKLEDMPKFTYGDPRPHRSLQSNTFRTWQ